MGGGAAAGEVAAGLVWAWTGRRSGEVARMRRVRRGSFTGTIRRWLRGTARFGERNSGGWGVKETEGAGGVEIKTVGNRRARV